MDNRIRNLAAAIALAVIGIVVLTQVPRAATLSSPLAQPLAFQSPLMGAPSECELEFACVETPTQLIARAVPFVDEYGETIVSETIVLGRIGHAPMIFDVKQHPASTPFTPTHVVYLPIMAANHRSSLPMNLFVIAYRPTGVMSYTPPSASYIQSITQQTLGDIQQSSIWHGYANPANTPSIQYSLHISGVVVVNTFPPTQTANGFLNLNAIYQQFNICNRAKAGGIDEVWIWVDGGTPGLRPYHSSYAPSEFAINGPMFSFYAPSLNAPNCGKTMLSLFLNFDTPRIENAVESYAHTWEYAMASPALPTTGKNIFGYEQCDWKGYKDESFYTAYQTAGNPQSYCAGAYTPTLSYAFSMRAAQENNFIAVCGDAHAAPNTPMYITQTLYPDRYDYYYPDLTTTVQSRCMDWQYGGGTVSNVNRDTWGPDCNGDWTCYHRKYLIWWMQNIPGLNNTDRGRSGAYRPDWWAIKIRPEFYKP